MSVRLGAPSAACMSLVRKMVCSPEGRFVFVASGSGLEKLEAPGSITPDCPFAWFSKPFPYSTFTVCCPSLLTKRSLTAGTAPCEDVRYARVKDTPVGVTTHELFAGGWGPARHRLFRPVSVTARLP